MSALHMNVRFVCRGWSRRRSYSEDIMNFLLRPAQSDPSDPPTVSDVTSLHKSTTTLEGLIAEDDLRHHSLVAEEENGENGVSKVVNGGVSSQTSAKSFPLGKHTNVTSDEGWIIVPCKEIPENWSDAEGILSFHSLDRSFIFPGEQLHILVCLSAAKQDTEVITPFKVAAVMSKNGIIDQHVKQQALNQESETNLTSDSDGKYLEENGESFPTPKMGTRQYISESESILRSESHKQQTRDLLERLNNSHFFVRIADCNEELVSAPNTAGSPAVIDATGKNSVANDIKPKPVSGKYSHLNAVVDKGNFDASLAGGIARNIIGCSSLSNGDIVVLLQVNIGSNYFTNPVLEVLQFEKHQNKNDIGFTGDRHTLFNNQVDPCGDLLKWLLPLDRSLPPPACALSPPSFSSSSAMIGSSSHRSAYPASSGSQLFSFGHFRSYSMSAVPQSMTTSPFSSSHKKPSFDVEDWDKYSSESSVQKGEVGNDGLLSFRGVALEQDRFSSLCGLEGIYIPGRRWTKKVEIVQPLEINSFSADCNSDDLLCVQIKNVSPLHTPDIIVYLDAITIVYEEAPNSEFLQSLPITCIEAGNDQSLPNIALKRGEEHSFILKPANIRDQSGYHERSKNSQYSLPSSTASNSHSMIHTHDVKKISTNTGCHYAVLVSCRCNYTDSKLFFKQSTSWRPRASRDLMISIASKMSEPSPSPRGGIWQLPVQVLTLRATNLTSEDLTLTVLAPASFTSPPSVVSLNPVPATPKSSNVGPSGAIVQKLNATSIVSEIEQDGGIVEQVPSSVPNTSLSCSHLWLQSTVPLGCVPSLSTATIKLELLPLANGIITLDTLQIAVKEKGVTYIPEHSLKIFATSSIGNGSL